MSVQLVQHPDYIYALAAQEIVFRSHNVVDTPGSYASWLCALDFSTLPTTGAPLVLAWNGVLQSAIWNWGTEIDVYTSGSHQEYTKYVVTQLSRSPSFSKDFIVRYLWGNDSTCYFAVTARQSGVYYNLTIPFIPAGLTFTATAVGVDEVDPSNPQLKISVDILSNDNYEDKVTRYDMIAIDAQIDSEHATADYTWRELPDMLRCLLGVDLPAWNQPFMHSKNNAKISLEMFQSSDAATESGQLLADFRSTISKPMIALNGGTFQFWDGTKAYWLRPAAAPTLIRPDQPLWLSLYLHYSIADKYEYLFGIYVTYDDGSTDSVEAGILNAKSQSFVCIPAGIAQFGFTPGSRIPVSVEIHMRLHMTVNPFTTTNYTDPLTLYYDNRHAEYKRYFVFKNSAGGLDTIVVKGMSEYITKMMRTTAIHTRSSSTTAGTGTITMETNEDERSWTMRTGWLLSLSELLYYRELLLSTYVAEVILPVGIDNSKAYNTPLKSVIVTAGSVNEYQEDAGKWSLEWTMKYADDQPVAAADTVPITLYRDSRIEAMISCPAGGAGCIILFIIEGDNINVTINGTALGNISSYDFPNNEKILNIVVEGVGVNYIGFLYDTGSVDMNLNITRISVPYSLFSLNLEAFTTMSYDYLISRIPQLGIYTIYLITNDPNFPTDLLLQLCAENYDKYGLLQSAILLYNPRGTSGSDARDWLVSFGVGVLTN